MRDNVKQTMQYFADNNIDADERHFVLNIGGVVCPKGGPCHYTENYIPTITATRGGARAYYSTFCKRRLTVTELMRLQGMSPERYPGFGKALSNHQAGHLVGNAMSITVVTAVLQQTLLASGICSSARDVPLKKVATVIVKTVVL